MFLTRLVRNLLTPSRKLGSSRRGSRVSAQLLLESLEVLEEPFL